MFARPYILLDHEALKVKRGRKSLNQLPETILALSTLNATDTAPEAEEPDVSCTAVLKIADIFGAPDAWLVFDTHYTY